MECSNALPSGFHWVRLGRVLPLGFSPLGKLVPASESAWKLFSSLLDQVWWWTRSVCWNSQKHEFKTIHKVVSWFCICILNINAQYKSVSLEVSGLCLQCVLPGFLLLMSWVINTCWVLRIFGKAIYCELTSVAAVEAWLNFLLASYFGWS